MKIEVLNASLEQVPGEVLVLFHFLDHLLPRGPLARVDWILNGLVSRLLYLGRSHGLRFESLLLSTSDKFMTGKVLVLGLGKKSDLRWDVLREAYAYGISISAKLKARKIVLTFPEESSPALLEEAARELLAGRLSGAAESAISVPDLQFLITEKDSERRNRFLVHFRQEDSGVADGLSLPGSLIERNPSCAT